MWMKLVTKYMTGVRFIQYRYFQFEKITLCRDNIFCPVSWIFPRTFITHCLYWTNVWCLRWWFLCAFVIWTNMRTCCTGSLCWRPLSWCWEIHVSSHCILFLGLHVLVMLELVVRVQVAEWVTSVALQHRHKWALFAYDFILVIILC